MIIESRSDYVIVGSDPEMADMDNPTGAIYGEVFYLVATLPSGRRFAAPPLEDRHWTPEELAKLVREKQSLVYAGIIHPEDEWTEVEPMYGSAAYVDAESEIVYMERMNSY